MANERYRHIFLPGPTRTQAFTSPRGGGGQTQFPPRDRFRHSAYLRQRFEQAWQEGIGRQAVSQATRSGTYIEFVSEPGFELTLQSLENRSAGIRLLNVQRRRQPDPEQTLANVYVPNDKRLYFLEKIRKYAEENTLRDRPKNAPLIDSISDIRLSVLESFWQDDVSDLPGETPQPVEVWISSDQEEVVSRFNLALTQLQIPRDQGTLTFPERSIEVVHANRAQLQNLIERSEDVAELRNVPAVASFFAELPNVQQVELVRSILERSQVEPGANLVVCILDTGVNNGHPLIQPLLSNADLHSARAEWGLADDKGHGTLMAGLAGYGDLLEILNSTGPISIRHRLESAKVLPPTGDTPKELWGHMTAQALSRAEIQAPERRRIVCIAVTSVEDRDRGRPSSWSAKLDSLASGYEGDTRRLIVVSAGNVMDPDAWIHYPEDNLTNDIHDPAQAWNALTVGAFTKKVQISDPTLANWVPIAPEGGLSPYSTTSLTWPERKWPIKPELVLEGGNVALGPNDSVLDVDDLQLLSTYRYPQNRQFAPFGMTSAACAQASRTAAQIQARYPDAWPETIRALMVHSATWTEAMKSKFLPQVPTKKDRARLLRICGWGVPNLNDALYCASNSLTLISQTDLQPFDRRNDGLYITRDMHLYRLPWPSNVLLGLGETRVSMRVTLSYFIEPGPGEIGWENRYRYPSHGLRFELNGPGETEEDFVKRVNKQARDEGERPGTEGPGDRWVIGNARNVGSIHSDLWQGSAADLSSSNIIAVYPTVGWWRERHYLNRWNKRCRYSLIVSIQSPREDVDIYTPVSVQLRIPIEVQITT
jgi:hypothetical protein